MVSAVGNATVCGAAMGLNPLARLFPAPSKLALMPYMTTTLLVLVPLLASGAIAFNAGLFFDRKHVSQQWGKVLRIHRALLPFLVLEDRKAATSLAKNLTGIGLCIATGRAVNLLCPLLLRYIVDRLAGGETVQQLQHQQQHKGSVASPAASFPWPQIVAYVVFQHVVPRVINEYERKFSMRMRGDATQRISAAVYRKLLSFGAQYHEGSRSDESKDAKEKSVIPHNVVFYSTSNGTRWLSHWLFSSAPGIVDLCVGLVAFWAVGGAMLAATMGAMLLLYTVTFLAEIVHADAAGASALRDTTIKISRDVLDRLDNWATVELCGTCDAEVAHYKKLGKSKHELEEQHDFFSLGEAPCLVAHILGVLTLSLVAGWQISRGERSVGDFVMLTRYYRDLISPLGQILWGLRRMGGELDRLMEVVHVLERQPAIRDLPGAPDFRLGGGTIEFRDVGFSYPGARQPALAGVSFTVGAGQMVALVGETGGGKSTVLKLLCRSHDVASGCVLVDGQDVREVRRASLLNHMAVVPQAAAVLRGSILENVRYGRPEATEGQVEDACRAAQLHNKITTAFAQGYAEKVSQNGSTQLSGGEAQRLAIARALVRDSQIVVFDEAMSSLDSETEWSIQSYLHEWWRDRTVVVVAHRLATVAQADLILAIKDGKIVEQGTQAELLAKEGYYHSLWTKQKLVA